MSTKGYHFSEETKQKISKSLKGKKLSALRVQRMVESRRGYRHSPETIAKIQSSNMGRKLTAEHRQKLSVSSARKGKPSWNAGTRGVMKAWNKGKSFPELSGPNSPAWKGGTGRDRSKRSRMDTLKRIRAGGLFHTAGEWELMKKQYGNICPCCKRSEPEICLTKDHIIPLSKGGTDLIENLQPLCQSCNSRKHTKEIKY